MRSRRFFAAVVTAAVLTTGVAVPAGAVADPTNPPPAAPASVSFTDVPGGIWYAQPVTWAVTNGITRGLGPGTFSPSVTTDRAMALTFLWRLAGEPTPNATTQFTDVPDGIWFDNAAHWAFEEGITFGAGGNAQNPSTRFDPYGPMTRAQFVAILWRLSGQPTIDVPAGFIDTTTWFVDAADWAANRGIASGDALAFSPTRPLSRAEAVTFLKRYNDDPGDEGIVAGNFSDRGNFEVGLREITVQAPGSPSPALVQIYYPVDGDTVTNRTPVTNLSSAEALGPPGSAFRNLVASIAPALIQNLPVNYYPDAPISDGGPFGVVLSSHGFSGDPRYVADHLSHLASWGLIVVAPSHPVRNLANIGSAFAPGGGAPTIPAGSDVAELRLAYEELLAWNVDEAEDFYNAVDDRHVAAEGHSAGGPAIAQLKGVGVPVDTLIGWATVPFTPSGSGETPVLLVPGERDKVVETAGIIAGFNNLPAPKQLVVIARAGHNPVLDICAPIRRQGGLTKYGGLLATLGQLGEDGCLDGFLLPGLSTALIRHLAVAQVRWAFGQDADRAALEEDFLRQEFRAAVGTVTTAPPD